MKSNKKNLQKENIYNIPNPVTALRVIALIPIIYGLFIADWSLSTITIIFVIGMFTDFLDGKLARGLNQVTEFGRKFDIAADRILMLGTIIALGIREVYNPIFDHIQLIQILLILSREILATPLVILGFLMKKPLPHATFTAKTLTFIQAIVFPLILFEWFNLNNSWWYALVIITSIIGISCAIRYAFDIFSKHPYNKEEVRWY